MKRGFLATLSALMLILAFQPRSTAAALILSKDAGGHVLPNALSLELRSNPDCDQTQLLIPDGSTLVSDRFILNVDERGIGFFAGGAKIVAPDGRTVLAGTLHGTIGLTTQSTDTTKPCQAPGHLEGMLNGPPPPTGAEPGPAVIPEPFEVNVSLDIIPQAAGIVPLYKGNLTGLIPSAPPPPPALVFITPGKALYAPNEPVVAIIANKTQRDIQVFDEQSYGTIVQMQHLVGQDWVMVGVWQYFAPPIPVVIKAGTEMKVLLPSDASSTLKHEPGTYRLVIDYQNLGADGKPLDGLQKVISPLFKVADLPPPVARLRVMPDKPGYTSTDAITAIIANGAMPVSILDEESLCTIVQLQRAEGIGWVVEGPCPLKRVAIPTILKPGEVKTVVLAKDSPWMAGRYRLAVTYTALDAAGNPAGPGQTAVSDPFPVGPPAPPALIFITPSKPLYATNEPVTAIIANRAERGVQVFDMQSHCTIVQMQQLVGNDWMTTDGCPWARMPIPVVIKGGTTLMVLLPPAAFTTFKHEPGTYRLVIDYQFLNTDGTVVEGFQKVISPLFTIADLPPPNARLRVMPDKPGYTWTDAITAIIANGAMPVSILDEESLCTIVQLQRAEGAGWVPEGPCQLDRLAIPTILKPGEVKAVVLAKNTPWQPGQYRLAVAYTPLDAAGNPAGPSQTSVSDTFPVGPPLPPQLVALTTDKRLYDANQPIIATFANKGQVDVVTWDHQSFCTVINLQIKDATGWRTIAPCMMMSPTLSVVIKAGESLVVLLPPDPSVAPKWEPGVYRLQATYGPGGLGGSPSDVMIEVVSEPFAVGLPPPPPAPMVVLTPDKGSYTLTQSIIATVTNRSNMNVTTWNHRSFCGVINLQMKAATGWRTIAPCRLMTPTLPVVIKAGGSLRVPLPPNTTTPHKWEAGVYRLQMQILYRIPISAGVVRNVLSEAVSEPFLVGVNNTGIVLQVPEMTTFTLP